MSGICDMCRRTTCEYRADDIAVCGLPKTETNYERLFGTPERAARTLVDSCNDDYDYGCGGCPIAHANCKCGDYDTILKWLRSDAE